MSIQRIGVAGSHRVKCQVAEFLSYHGIHSQTSWFYAGEDMRQHADRRVWLVDDAPFVEIEGNLIPYASNRYALYRDVYLPRIKWWHGSPVPGVNYPMMIAGSWDEFLTRNKSYRPHMIGAKSKRIEWRAEHHILPLARMTHDLAPVFDAHAEQMGLRYSLDPVVTEIAKSSWRQWGTWTDARWMVYAVDLEQQERVIVAMQIWMTADYCTMDCGHIAVPTDPEYRPYSLVVCAQLAAARLAFELGVKHVNFGLNPPGIGDYKAAFSVPEPVLGLTYEGIQQWL